MVKTLNNATSVLDIPVDRDNEAVIIANAILKKDHLITFARKVTPLDFRSDDYRAIAYALQKIEEEKLAVDLDTIRIKSQTSPFRNNVPIEFLQELVDTFQVLPENNYETHLHKLKVDSVKFELSKYAIEGIYQSCLNPSSSLPDLQVRVDHLQRIIEGGFSASQSEFKSMNELVDDYVEFRNNTVSFRTTGFRQIDKLLSDGLGDGKVTIVAGLPGMGKSSFVLTMMKRLANQKIPVPTAQFALEMNSMSLMTKMLAFNTHLAVKRITKHYHELTEAEKKILEYWLTDLRTKKIYIDDKPTQTLAQIKEQIMLLQDRIKEQYIVVPIDLFGKISDFSSADNFAKSYEQKLNEVQQMARSLGVHFILVAQINRTASQRKMKRPTMAHLKNSGAFEEVADLIFAINRPYYDPDVALKESMAFGDQQEDNDEIEEDPNKNIAEVILLKNRMGEGNKLVNFTFNPETTLFVPIDASMQDEINRQKTVDDS